MDSCGFIDLNVYGPRFTWTNKHHGSKNIQQRLDQCWRNRTWHESFTEASLHHLPRTHSDHNPIMLELSRNYESPTIFRGNRFQANWMEHKDFREFVTTAWPPLSVNLHEAISIFWERLKIWNRDVYGNLFHTKRRYEARLMGIQKALEAMPSRFLGNLEDKLVQEYGNVLRQEETLWRQRNHLNWLAEGERNSRLFHKSLAGRRAGSKCTSLG